MAQKNQFAKLLKAARQRDSLSQSQAAKAWGLKLKNLQNWEQGLAHPAGSMLLELLPRLQPPPQEAHELRTSTGPQATRQR